MKNPRELFPAPQMMGLFLLFTAAFGLAAGIFRKELILILLGAVFFTVWIYCYLGALFLACLHRKRARTLSTRMVPPELGPGQPGAVFCSRGDIPGSGGAQPFFRLPGFIIRCEIELHARDGRRFSHVFDPDGLTDDLSPFPPAKRGAYYSDHDLFSIFDAVGLFRVSFKLPPESNPRLLVLPGEAEEVVNPAVHSGGQEQRIEPSFQRTDNFIDHRPYVPGDDPRRINWKLYSHIGDLFVREGEPEPPPHSRLVILIDTQTDPLLYSPEAGRRGVDLLCEQTLALAREYANRGMDILIGYTGGTIREGIPGGPAVILAHPAAMPLRAGIARPELAPTELVPRELPDVPEDRGTLLLALPRTVDRELQGETALDRFLKKQGSRKTTYLLFLYTENTENGGPEEAAERDVIFYNRKGGVHARSVKL
jgi:hypothetical protein